MMAAKTNLSPLKARESFLERYITILREVYDASELKRIDAETQVLDCQQLLKPCPKPGEGYKATADPISGTSNQKVTPEIGIDELPSEELEALSIAEKALAQAQRLRQRQAKVITCETLTCDPREGSSIDVTKKEVTPSPSPSVEADLKPSGEKNVPLQTIKSSRAKINISKGGITRENKGRKQPVTDQSRYGPRDQVRERQQRPSEQNISQDARSVQVRSASQRSSAGKAGRSSSVNSEIKSGGNVGVISQSSLNRVLGRPRSGQKSKLGYRPAHVSAPFKTEPPPARFKSRPVLTARSKPTLEVKNNVSGKIVKQRENSDLRQKEKLSSDDLEEGKTLQHVNDAIERTRAEDIPTAAWVAEDLSHFQEAENDQRNRNPFIQSEIEIPHCSNTEPEQKQKMFDIVSEGSTLPVPSKLRKSVGKNKKLQQQIQLAALKCQALQENSARLSFLNKLTEHYESQTDEEDILHKLVIQSMALYKKLSHIMNTHLSVKFDDDSSWQDIIRSKRMLENICLQYADMEDTYVQVAPDEMSNFENRGLENIRENSKGHAFWIPARYIEGVKLNSSHLKYRRLKDMEEYISLIHQMQLLKLDLLTMDLAAESLLPLIRHVDPTHSSFQLFYRATYSLICTVGKRSPMIIQDLGD